MPNVSVNLDVTVDASGQVGVFGQTPSVVGNVAVASITLPTADLYTGSTNGLLRFQQPTVNPDTITAERYSGFTGTAASLAADLKNILAGSFDVSAATPYKTYSSSYHEVPSFGYLALGAYAHSLFGHVQATAAIDNDVVFVSKMIGDGVGDASLNQSLASAIYALSGTKSTSIAKQVVGQDGSRTRIGDNTQNSPDMWQMLEWKTGDIIYMSIHLLAPTVVVSNAAQQSAPAASLYSNQTYVLKITLGDGSPAPAPTPAPGPSAPVISYNTPNTYVVNDIVSLAPSSTGGAVVSYSVSPALPADLSIDPLTGIVSGSASAIAALAYYTITATNSGGSGSTSVSITVNNVPSVALPAINYSNPSVIGQNATQTINVAGNSGGAVDVFAIDPTTPLPNGLTINSATGSISGNTSLVGDFVVNVLATNAAGTQTFSGFTITVMPLPVITYSSPMYYTQGVPIADLMPTSTGGSISGYIITSLPNGLTYNSTTGIITGTPTNVDITMQVYNIKAANAAGQGDFNIQIMVYDPLVGPPLAPHISYNGAQTFYTGTPVNVQAISTGGYADTIGVKDQNGVPLVLPGLVIDKEGNITGVPTAELNGQIIEIYFTNAYGSNFATVFISIVQTPPVISYAVVPNFTVGVPITSIMPNITGGGAPTSFSGSLPAGLTLDNVTGEISGTPTVVAGATEYYIVGYNSGGASVPATILITINNVAPAFSYPDSVFIKGQAVSLMPTITAGNAVIDPLNFSSSGLPTGLQVQNNGLVSGTPSAVLGETEYTITASNSIGSTDYIVKFTVNPPPTPPHWAYPAVDVYSGNITVYQTLLITPIYSSVYNDSGAIDTWSFDPAFPLPAGLVLGSDGSITGTPTTVAPATDSVIIATNQYGSQSKTLRITVLPLTAPALIYVSPTNLTVNVDCGGILPTNNGGPISSITGNLPNGLSFDDFTSSFPIVGTPNVITPLTTYTFEVTGPGGTSTATINIEVGALAEVVYSNQTLTVGVPCSILPNYITGSPDYLELISTLPDGLILNSTTGEILGTPTASRGLDTFLIKSVNKFGEKTNSFGIEIVA